MIKIEISDSIKNWIGTIIGIVVIVLIIFGILKIREYYDNQPKSRIYVYACSVDESSSCYKAPADKPKCADRDEEGICYSYVTTIYPPKEDEIYLDCIPSSSHATLICSDPDSDKEWEIEESDDRTKEKYYPDGTMAR